MHPRGYNKIVWPIGRPNGPRRNMVLPRYYATGVRPAHIHTSQPQVIIMHTSGEQYLSYLNSKSILSNRSHGLAWQWYGL